MESNPLVFDISSDDDEAASPAWLEPKGDDYDWLSEVLESVDKGFDDPDEVVVVGEFNSKPSAVSKVFVGEEADDDDDECLVLDGDPDKAVCDVNDYQEDSDDLVFVGQKGQIACRDFPHPRHDCANFPFSSTSHEQHCELCHCFVCDTHAPCLYWGLGTSKSDHCHATDKEELWKTLRKTFRQGRNVSVPVPKAPVICQSTAVPQVNQAPFLDIIQPTFQNQVSQPTLALQNQVSRPTPTHDITLSRLQNKVSRPTPAHDISRPTSQNQVSQPTLTAQNQVSQRTRTSQNQVSQLTLSQPTLTSQNQVFRPTPTRAAGNCIPQNNVPRSSIIRPCSSSTRYGSPYNPSLGSRHLFNKNTMQPHSVSQQFLGVHNTGIRKDRGNNISSLGSQIVSSNALSKRLSPGVASAVNQTVYVPSGNGTSAHASQHQQNSAPVTVPNIGNPGGLPNFCSGPNVGTYAHQSSLQPCMDSVFTNSAPSLSSVSQPLPHSTGHPVSNQLPDQNQPATNYGSEFDFNWVNSISQSNQQSSVDFSPYQTLGSTNEGEPFNEVRMREIDNLLFEKQTVPENPVTAEYNALSPDLSFDTGMLFFDIDTSWDRLTRA